MVKGDLKSLILCVLMNFVSSKQPYCEFDFCNEEEYCCGYNKCCSKPLDLWFLWLGIVVVCFALTIATIIRCIRKNRPKSNTYKDLTSHC